MLTYYDVGIYFKYYTSHPPSKLVEMWQKTDVSRKICDGECKRFLNKQK